MPKKWGGRVNPNVYLQNVLAGMDQAFHGTRPVDFATDRAKTIALIHRFVGPDARYSSHPVMGPLTPDEWMIWAWRHTDHHLRQFAL